MPDETPHRPLRPSGPPLGGDREITYTPRSWWEKHRYQLIVAVVVVLAVGGVGAAVLATRNLGDVSVSDPGVAASSAAPSSSAPAPAPKPVATVTPGTKTTAKGAVTAVLATGKWTLKVEGGISVTVVTTPATTYARQRSADDVRKGSQLTVVGSFTAGVLTASTVTIEKKKAT